ncbi:hypothetical protein R7D66_23610 [Vibrio sp. Vb2354]|uniref:hypothetical protein n=1 Tax=unclassified Vibrio TaxID=2614977 RepID=UPI002964B973|nr:MULTISPECIES: hypothetical protein [unclassified Vibrio]MDW1741493.1 hypothetical protein [Vibrio sp. Vb2321]MDW1760582.1 hypothetical protein [Vibrio sp. Vb2353]MDW1774878.1 hypothetical protein [Vibrio sp. Vb2354]MDW1809315.1 hypothetical protein [Vibrio sp. Vb2362]
MTILKNSVKSQIVNQLNNANFCREDFEVEFHSSGNTFVTITFNPRPEYQLDIYESNGRNSNYLALMAGVGGRSTNEEVKVYCRMSPGEYKNTESKSYDDLDSAISIIYQWLNYIKEDLVNLKNSKEFDIDDFTQSFQQQIDEKIEDPDSYFTTKEAEDLKDKLDSLYTRVSELESQLDLSSEDTQKLEKTIDKTKSDIDIYPKGVWYKTACNKIINTVKDVLKTKEGRQALFDVAKKLLENT